MFSSLHGTDLQAQLQREGIHKVIVAGLTSQTRVEGTGRDALEAGYHVTFIKEAVADFTEAAHRAALEVSYPVFGHETLTVDDFLAAISSAEHALRPLMERKSGRILFNVFFDRDGGEKRHGAWRSLPGHLG